MEENKSEYRIIEFETESCPPGWCPLKRNELPREGCCHACRHCGDDDHYYCSHPKANEETPLNMAVKSLASISPLKVTEYQEIIEDLAKKIGDSNSTGEPTSYRTKWILSLTVSERIKYFLSETADLIYFFEDLRTRLVSPYESEIDFINGQFKTLNESLVKMKEDFKKVLKKDNEELQLTEEMDRLENEARLRNFSKRIYNHAKKRKKKL